MRPMTFTTTEVRVLGNAFVRYVEIEYIPTIHVGNNIVYTYKLYYV